ncbi:hypothetical protein K9M59_03895 [Candidatus Gracilibacteria bacterium]|nr:hypothetical protein [Candidatus Gracilibacteria bacterium]MCF7819466.1 hypothetical protein [Candidatus Gracilibacteria bacterium]
MKKFSFLFAFAFLLLLPLPSEALSSEAYWELQTDPVHLEDQTEKAPTQDIAPIQMKPMQDFSRAIPAGTSTGRAYPPGTSTGKVSLVARFNALERQLRDLRYRMEKLREQEKDLVHELEELKEQIDQQENNTDPGPVPMPEPLDEIMPYGDDALEVDMNDDSRTGISPIKESPVLGGPGWGVPGLNSQENEREVKQSPYRHKYIPNMNQFLRPVSNSTARKRTSIDITPDIQMLRDRQSEAKQRLMKLRNVRAYPRKSLQDRLSELKQR